MTPDDRAREGSGPADSFARFLPVVPHRWRIEFRPPLSEPIFAADSFSDERARYLQNQLLTSRMKLPHTLHYAITVIAYDINGNTLWEEVS